MKDEYYVATNLMYVCEKTHLDLQRQGQKHFFLEEARQLPVLQPLVNQFQKINQDFRLKQMVNQVAKPLHQQYETLIKTVQRRN